MRLATRLTALRRVPRGIPDDEEEEEEDDVEVEVSPLPPFSLGARKALKASMTSGMMTAAPSSSYVKTL